MNDFAKPVIFMLLGAMVPLLMLMEHALLGALAAIVFMFVVRPAVVFFSLLPWMVKKRARITWREVLFISFIRETGAIPAVLILTIVASGVASSAFILTIGMWVILYTLVIEPPLTPLLAHRLGITKE